jgi:hypothetical protein
MPNTDTSEKGLETLIIRHVTGAEGLASVAEGTADTLAEYINTPLATTQADQLGLQARLERLGFLCIQICPYFHSFLAFENPGTKFPTVVPSPEIHRTLAGASP